MKNTLGMFVMVSMLGLGYTTSVAAQALPETSATRNGDVRDNDDRGFDLGWLGLLGLAGLLALKRDRGVARHDTGHASTGR